MARMTLGSYTFVKDPQQMTLLDKVRITATVLTYSSVAFFSWGASIVGKKIELYWPVMSAAMYASIQAILEADAEVEWNPNDGELRKYTVEVLSFDGEYLIDKTYDTTRRKDMRLVLLIKSEEAITP